MNLRESVVYKGKSFVCLGTIKECAQQMGALPETIKFYKRPVAERKNARNYITVTELGDH
ncbi:hypothetical protein [Bacillus sp. NPDC094077]|uniref:hypothetical protein n=1 Tax=Bacillus sp. NPDC094077 TaxID=3390932 RepID=UPI003D059AB4